MLNRIANFMLHPGPGSILGRALRFDDHPFVVKKIPFICLGEAPALPFITLNMPSVDSINISRGFTMVELMIALVIGGILLGLAVPSMQTFISDNRLSTQANDLLADLQIARTEAIKRGTFVTVCKSTNPTAADVPATPAPACNTTTADRWTTGRIMFVDSGSGTAGNDGNGVRDAGEELLRTKPALEGNNTRLFGDAQTTGTANYVTYVANGLTRLVPANDTCVVTAGTPFENQFVMCDGRGISQARVIVIAPTGRIRIATKGSDMNGDVLTAIACGSALRCPTL